MENIGRTVAMLDEGAVTCSGAPSPEDWHAALGVPLPEFVELAFAVFVMAMRGGGVLTRPVRGRGGLRPAARGIGR